MPLCLLYSGWGSFLSVPSQILWWEGGQPALCQCGGISLDSGAERLGPTCLCVCVSLQDIVQQALNLMTVRVRVCVCECVCEASKASERLGILN